MKDWIKKYGVHLVAIVAFLAVCGAYFSPAMKGQAMNQPDIKNFSGMVQEIKHHRETFDEDPGWTNSMFGGMPADQISMQHDSNVLLKVDKAMRLWLPAPMNYVFLFMLGFYVLMLVLRVNPWVALAGAVAYGLSSYFIIVIGAGHNSKAAAIGYMAPIVAGFILTYRRNLLLGGALSALAMGLGLSMNHPQIIYYLGFLLFFLGFVELLRAVLGNDKLVETALAILLLLPLGVVLIILRWGKTDLKPHFDKTQFLRFLKATGITLVAYGLAFLANYSQLTSTLNYSPYTIRGGDILTAEADTTVSKDAVNQKGLDYEYITQWSYGKPETMTFFVPNAQGGTTSHPIGKDEKFAEKVQQDIISDESISAQVDKRQVANAVINSSSYHGDQPGTSGPVYIGALVMFLAILGLVYLKDPLKWAFFAGALVAVMLSWGKNAPGLTHWMIDHFPGYSLFRAVTIILVIAELTLPVLAFVGLDRLLKHKELIADDMKKFYITSGAIIGLILVLIMAPGVFGIDFLSSMEQEQFASVQERALKAGGPEAEAQIAFYDAYSAKLKEARMSIFRKDGFRTLFFMVVGALTLWFFARSANMKRGVVVSIIGVLCLVDLYTVDTRYVNNDEGERGEARWIERIEKEYPLEPLPVDMQILNQESAGDPELAQRIQHVRDSVMTQYKGDPDLAKYSKRIADWAAFRELGMHRDFRVWDNTGGPWSSSRASYFHKSLGGYHGAKLRRIQDIMEHQIQTGNQGTIFNMFNVRYILTTVDRNQDGKVDDYQLIPNPQALGSAWCVSDVKWAEDADQEMAGLDTINPRYTAVMNSEFKDKVPRLGGGTGTVKLKNYKANHISYEFESDNDELVVFSQVWYPEGWTATIDGKEAPIMRADYILRALHVPAGRHTIEMSYKNLHHEKGKGISAAGSWSIVALVLGVLGFCFWRMRKASEKKTEA